MASASSGATDTRRSLGELLSSLLHDLRSLWRQELELVKTELGQTLQQALGTLIGLIIGGVIGLLGALALTATLVLALALVMPAWAAALIVGSFLAVLGATIVWVQQRKLRALQLAPEHTLKSLEDSARRVTEKFA
jgi:uncharacterized protein YacL